MLVVLLLITVVGGATIVSVTYTNTEITDSVTLEVHHLRTTKVMIQCTSHEPDTYYRDDDNGWKLIRCERPVFRYDTPIVYRGPPTLYGMRSKAMTFNVVCEVWDQEPACLYSHCVGRGVKLSEKNATNDVHYADVPRMYLLPPEDNEWKIGEMSHDMETVIDSSMWSREEDGGVYYRNRRMVNGRCVDDDEGIDDMASYDGVVCNLLAYFHVDPTTNMKDGRLVLAQKEFNYMFTV